MAARPGDAAQLAEAGEALGPGQVVMPVDQA